MGVAVKKNNVVLGKERGRPKTSQPSNLPVVEGDIAKRGEGEATTEQGRRNAE